MSNAMTAYSEPSFSGKRKLTAGIALCRRRRWKCKDPGVSVNKTYQTEKKKVTSVSHHRCQTFDVVDGCLFRNEIIQVAPFGGIKSTTCCTRQRKNIKRRPKLTCPPLPVWTLTSNWPDLIVSFSFTMASSIEMSLTAAI